MAASSHHFNSLRLPFSPEILSKILVFNKDIGLAIKFESILNGLPRTHRDPSTAYNSIDPTKFPASMALTMRSAWLESAHVSKDSLGSGERSSSSLCEIYWIIQFRSHILMWENCMRYSMGWISLFGPKKEWERMATGSSVKVFKALHVAKIAEGFPMDLMNFAIGDGNIPAVQYLTWLNERINADGDGVESAICRSQVHMIRYLIETKGVILRPDAIETACSRSSLEMVEYLATVNDITPECLYNASGRFPERPDQLQIVKFLLARKAWSMAHIRKAISEAVIYLEHRKDGQAVVEELCSYSRGLNSIKVSLAKTIGFITKPLTPLEEGVVSPVTLGNDTYNYVKAMMRRGEFQNLSRLNGYCRQFNLDHFLVRGCSHGNIAFVEFIMKLYGQQLPDPKSCAEGLEKALGREHFEVADFLRRRTGVNGPISLNFLVHQGSLGGIKYAMTHCDLVSGSSDLDIAAAQGSIEIVKLLHQHFPNSCTTDAMNRAAEHGHLEVVKWLHLHRTEGCTKEAMNLAASKGHLDVVRWLHFNRSEGCTTDALDMAAENPKATLSLIKFLHKHRFEGCTTRALDAAAKKSDPSIMLFLHRNCSEGCTTAAVDGAAEQGLLYNVKFLLRERSEGSTLDGLRMAISNGHVEVAELLLRGSSPALVKDFWGAKACSDLYENALTKGFFDVARFLIDNGLVDVPGPVF
ncbi:hypothetical protein HDU97_008540 [Phlyctochytrium planicorne]|nr:hypothetical protein HDU97_008540 [Phlyctochytrium planicorne]